MNALHKTLVSFIILSLFSLSCEKNEKVSMEPELPLSISHYYPNSGSIGAIITVEGENWGQDPKDIQIFFGTIPAEVISIGKRQLLVRVPSASGAVDIQLKHKGSSFALGTFHYQTLSVAEIHPNRGAVGSQIRIKGSGLAGGTGIPEVYINGEFSNVINVTDTLITVEVPNGGGVGPVKVVVADEESTGPIFQYVGVREVKPLKGGAGSIMKIFGEGFAEADLTVSFSDQFGRRIPAQILESTDERVDVLVPEGTVGGPVTVQIGAIMFDGGNFITVPPPAIFKLTPESGVAGATIEIEGSYFGEDPDEITVFINDEEIPIQSSTESIIKLLITEAVTSGPIRVEVSGRSVQGPDFRYQHVGLTELSPNNGLPGSIIQIHGSGFNTVSTQNEVLFSGIPAEVIDAKKSVLTVRVPQGAISGRVQVVVDGLSARSPDEFLIAGVTTMQIPGLQLAPDAGSIVLDDNGNLYTLDLEGHRILKISPDGQISHFAGSRHREKGLRDGIGDEVLFHLDRNSALLFDNIKNTIFVSDPQNEAFRRLTLEGKSLTIATPGQPVGNMGLLGKGNILFNPDDGIILGNALRGKTHVFFYNFQYEYPNVISNFPLSSRFGHIRFAVDNRMGPTGHLADVFGPGSNFSMNESVISKFLNNGNMFYSFEGGTIHQWAGNQHQTGYKDGIGQEALFNRIKGIVEENDQYILVLDEGNHALRRINKDNASVTTVFKNDPGFEDGDFRTAKISGNVSDIAVNKEGTIAYILDNGNNAIRKVQLR